MRGNRSLRFGAGLNTFHLQESLFHHLNFEGHPCLPPLQGHYWVLKDNVHEPLTRLLSACPSRHSSNYCSWSSTKTPLLSAKRIQEGCGHHCCTSRCSHTPLSPNSVPVPDFSLLLCLTSPRLDVCPWFCVYTFTCNPFAQPLCGKLWPVF